MTGLGLDLDTENIACIKFADDLILVGKNDEALSDLMDITRTFFKNHRLELSEKKSKIMSLIASTGHTTFIGTQSFPVTLEEVLCFKYLGVSISCSPYSMFKKYNELVKKRSQSYLASVMSLVKTGPDRTELAHTLWTRCALPSILYGCEVMPLTQDAINVVEKCQHQVGKFMLQLPRSSANVSASIDAGLKPVWALIADRVLLYACSTLKKDSLYWPKVALNVNLASGYKSPYTRYLLRWKSATDSSIISEKIIRKNVSKAAIDDVLKEHEEHSTTTFPMNTPDHAAKWFKPKSWVTDSCSTKIIARFRACNVGLGNRGPTKDGQFYSLCPLCAEDGIDALNNEVF